MSSFNAAFAGECANQDCDGIKVGDLIRFTDSISSRVRHVVCPEPKAPETACWRCFTVPAKNGACGCE